MEDVVSAEVSALLASTQSLLRTVSAMTDEEVSGQSLLPGWTRGHVLTHLARNADAMVNLATWAGTGVETPMYPSREHRSADIEAGSTRSARDLLDDVTASAQRLLAAFDALDRASWKRVVEFGSASRKAPASRIPVVRRVEVEVHHVDLDLGYTLAHLPEDFVEQMIAERVDELSQRGDITGFVLTANDDEGRWTVKDGGAEITGTPPSLLGWLIGRTDGIGLHSDVRLPDLGAWR